MCVSIFILLINLFFLLDLISEYLCEPYLNTSFDVVLLQDEIEALEMLTDRVQFAGAEVVFIESVGEFMPPEKVDDTLVLNQSQS